MAAVVSRRGRSARRRSVAEINVVPYIDVMLVLLIIFMVTAPMLQQGIEVKVPQTGGAKTVLDEGGMPLVLSVDVKGNHYLNTMPNPNSILENDAQTIAGIKAYLQKHPEAKTLVKGDKDARYADVVRLMALLKDAGAKNIGIVTDSIEEGK